MRLSKSLRQAKLTPILLLPKHSLERSTSDERHQAYYSSQVALNALSRFGVGDLAQQ